MIAGFGFSTMQQRDLGNLDEILGRIADLGASHAELAAFLREIATYCGSTALAFSMHSHVVATAVWRWRHDKAPLEPLLRRIAGEQLALVSSGGSDWLPSSGTAEPVPGGFRIRARKVSPDLRQFALGRR